MAISEQQVLRIIYPQAAGVRGRRFTQDTPILPDVWIKFGTEPKGAHELLLTPHKQSSIRDLVTALRRRLRQESPKQRIRLAYNESHVLVRVDYRQLIRAVLPLSSWWAEEIGSKDGLDASILNDLVKRPDFELLLMEPARQDKKGSVYTENLLNLIRVVGAIALEEPLPEDDTKLSTYLRRAVRKVQELVDGLDVTDLKGKPSPLWNVFSNREATTALFHSRLSVKADAAVLLFKISCRTLRWAVIDSGIDARHSAFRKDSQGQDEAGEDFSHRTRVAKTYDFTRLKELIQNNFKPADGQPSIFGKLSAEERRRITRDIQRRLSQGQPLDWTLLEKFLEIPHDGDYRRPGNEHGTHVAGILGANWPDAKNGESLIGICPDIEIYDLRVVDDDGTGDEFGILAALQYARYVNLSKGRTVIHGVNLSLSIPHRVQSFACGSTPVCEECNRLVGSGIVVVAAAGNSGYGGQGINAAVDYRDISITDPGNAEDVITVGATHPAAPHKYGVSYFSSRGPTGDGRQKPDLVAPGEQICSTIPGDNVVTLDGTSMAAPHVSGAAALLMARYTELVGEPLRIKEILAKTATDLGRDKAFQGAGLLDVLRALQSV
jgi:serine protease AprX